MIARAPVPCAARALFARALAASVATAASRGAETVATGTFEQFGLRGAATLARDGATGRFALRTTLPTVGATAEVFDGRTLWVRDGSGGVRPLDAPFRVRLARTDAYLARRAYLDPNEPAAMRCLGTREDAGRRLTDVRIDPPGGVPATLSLDGAARVVAVAEAYPTTVVETRYADFRRTHGELVPFAIAQSARSQPQDATLLRVARYAAFARARPADFARPQPDGRMRMLGGVRATTVPLRVEDRRPLVWASLDGHVARPFLLDTGASALVTPAAAAALGLRVAGAGVTGGAGAGTVAIRFARVRTLRVGHAELLDQPVAVVPFGAAFTGRGRGEAPVAGILGDELFERFAARLDYGRGLLTLAPFADYRPPAGARAVPIAFEDVVPMARGAVDGDAGLFQLDTGNAGALVLFGDYLRRTGLGARYARGVARTSLGAGGDVAERRVRVARFAIGGLTFARVVADLTAMRAGFLSGAATAGNVGTDVLARLDPTFDYAAGVVELPR